VTVSRLDIVSRAASQAANAAMQQFRFPLSAEHLGVNIGADAAYEGLTAEEVLRPETSPILQEIAKDLRSHNAERQSRAIMRAVETLSSSKNESISASDLKERMTPPQVTVNCSAFHIEAGIMAPTSVLLKRAAQGTWLECKVEGAATATYNWAATCANALFFLVEDMRTFRAVSASVPRLFDVLADLYLKGIETPVKRVGVVTDRDVEESKQDARQNVLKCLAHLALWSPRFRSQCARHVALLIAILEHSLAYLEDSGFNYKTFLLLYNVFHLTDNPTLDAGVLWWISEIIYKFRDRSLLEGVCNFLSQITLEDGYQKRALDLSTCTVLIQPCRILAACPGNARLKLLGSKLGVAIQASNSGSGSAKESRRRFEESARKESTAVHFAQRLASVLSEPFFPQFFPRVRGRDPDAQYAPMATAYMLDARAKRACSGPGCENREKKPGEFKVCLQCRLSVYCSRGTALFSSFECGVYTF
jgi:hypothetical protein